MVPARDRATDFADARFTIRAVIAIVVATVTVVGNQWWSSANLQMAITQLSARMDSKDEIDVRDAEAAKRETAADQKVFSDWRANMERRLDEIEREYKLADYDTRALIEKQRR